MIIILSWRNLWRNKRRTLITVGSIVFAIVFANIMDSLLLGVNKQMTDSMVGVYSGHFQIQQAEYWEDKSLHNSFIPASSLVSELNNRKDIKGYSFRLEGVALAAANEITKGAMVVGIDHKKEREVTGFNEKIIDGNYLDHSRNKALIGKGVADKMNISLGDSIVLVGEGYHGTSAADKYEISGIIRLGSPDLDNNIVILTLKDAQELYGAFDRVTSIPVFLKPKQTIEVTKNDIENKLDNNFIVKPWQNMMPMVTQSIGLIDAMRVIVIILLYILISFSILGTIIMMTHERLTELRILLAIGMKKSIMQIMLIVETIFLSLFGALIGFFASYPIVSYFNINPIQFRGKAAAGWESFGIDPIMPTIVDFSVFIRHTLIILVVSILLAIYSLRKITRLKTVHTIK